MNYFQMWKSLSGIFVSTCQWHQKDTWIEKTQVGRTQLMFKSYALSLKQELNLETGITVFLDRDQEPRQSPKEEKDVA